MLRTSGGYGVWAGALLALVVLTSGCPNPTETVFFEDQNLEAAVRDELDHPFGFLTKADLLDMRELNAKGRNITDLSGIEFCTNLDWLDLDTNTFYTFYYLLTGFHFF